jgi:hypothetical protein
MSALPPLLELQVSRASFAFARATPAGTLSDVVEEGEEILGLCDVLWGVWVLPSADVLPHAESWVPSTLRVDR